MNKYKTIYSLITYFFGITLITLIFNKINDFYQMGNIIKYIIIIALLIFINYKSIKTAIVDYKSSWFKYLKKYFFIWLSGFILMTISMYFINHNLPSNEENIRVLMTKYPLMIFIINCFLAPIIEEIVFRESFKSIKNKYLFLIITSFIFAIAHISSQSEFIYLIPYTILGLTFGYIFWNSKNILVSITYHMIHNILVFVLLFIF